MDTNKENQRRTKAVAQIREALKDSSVAPGVDAETRALLAEHPEMLVGLGGVPFYPDIKQLIDSIATIPNQITSGVQGAVRDISQEAQKIETTAGQMVTTAATIGDKARDAASSAAKVAVTEALGDVKQTVDWVTDGMRFVEGGTVTVAKKITSGVVEGVLSPAEKDMEDRLKKIANKIVEKVPFVTLIEALLAESEEYEKRAAHIVRSVLALEKALNGEDPSTVKKDLTVSLKNLESLVLTMVKFLWHHSVPGVLVSLVKDPSVENLMSKVFPMPPKVEPNFLYKWLTEIDIDSDELEFRKELIASIDQFVRNKHNVEASLAMPAGASAKTGLTILSEFFSVIFSVIGGYTFRHPNVPSLSVPKLHWTSPVESTGRPFNGAHVVSTGVSRSVSFAVKGAIGTVGRGVWEINVHNDALIEGTASAISSAIGAVIQSVLNDLFWSVEVREIYEEQRANAVVSWDCVKEGNGSKVYWGVTFRTNVIPKKLQSLLEKEFSKIPDRYVTAGAAVSEIVSILQSYTAYMDAIRSYTEIESKDQESDEVITFTNKDPKALKIEYAAAGDKERCPVLRAYCHGQIMVMKPESFAAADKRSYSCSFDKDVPENASVFVRSNWGGMERSGGPATH